MLILSAFLLATSYSNLQAERICYKANYGAHQGVHYIQDESGQSGSVFHYSIEVSRSQNPYQSQLSFNSPSISFCDPGGMTSEQLRNFFARNEWTSDQILNQLAWYMHDSFVLVAKQLPEYGMCIDRLYDRWNNVSDQGKIWGWLTNEYVSGLEDRIRSLKREKDHLEERKRDECAVVAARQRQQQERHEVASVFQEEFFDLEATVIGIQLDSDMTVGGFFARAGYHDKRQDALQEITITGGVYDEKVYAISDDVRRLLETSCSPGLYKKCYGNQLQQVIHEECMEMLEATAAVPLVSPLREYTPVMVDLIDATREYNQSGYCNHALQIADVCHALVDYSQAVAEGAVAGLAGVVQYAVDHPLETIATVVAPELTLMYQVSNILYGLGDIGMTYLEDISKGQEKLADYIAPLTDLVDALNNNQMTGPATARLVTQFAVNWKASNKLFSGLGKLYGGVKNKLTNFVKEHPTATVANYITTSEGQVFKVFAHPELEQECKELIEVSKQSKFNNQKKGNLPQSLKNNTNSTTSVQKPLIYNHSDKHGKITRGDISAAPKNGQKALEDSFYLEGNSKLRIAVCDNEIVLLRFTGEFHDRIEYHGHIITSKQLKIRSELRDLLLEKGLVNFEGKIIKKER